MSVWDHYLDVHDAAALLAAAEAVERHHAVREPLPFDDPRRLLDRLRTIATLCSEDVVHWSREAGDRREDASVDGGRWGSPAVAARMAELADGTAAAFTEIATLAAAAAEDLAARLGATERGDDPEGRLLGELGIDTEPPVDPDST